MIKNCFTKRYGPHGLLTKGVLLIEDGGSIERDDAKVLCANILSVKYDFLREGGEILVAEKPRHDWPTHGAGGDFIYYDAHKFTSPLDTINV